MTYPLGILGPFFFFLRWKEYNDNLPNPVWNFPSPNVWLGISAEDQARLDQRRPYLLRTPAVVRFVSCEPLLGEVDLSQPCPKCGGLGGGPDTAENGGWCRTYNGKTYTGLDWVILGGESGPGARPCHPDWVRSLQDQCQESGTLFFFKSWGATMAGRELDGQIWKQFPKGVA